MIVLLIDRHAAIIDVWRKLVFVPSIVVPPSIPTVATQGCRGVHREATVKSVWRVIGDCGGGYGDHHVIFYYGGLGTWED